MNCDQDSAVIGILVLLSVSLYMPCSTQDDPGVSEKESIKNA